MSRYILGTLLLLGIYGLIFSNSTQALSCSDPELPSSCYSAFWITIEWERKYSDTTIARRPENSLAAGPPKENIFGFWSCPTVKLDCSKVQNEIKETETQIVFVIILGTLGLWIIVWVMLFLILRKKYESMQLIYDRFVRNNQTTLIVFIASMLIFIAVSIYKILQPLYNLP